MEASTAALLRLLAIVAAIGVLWFFGDRAVAFVRAPVQAELSAARGNNAAFKAGADAQNKGVDDLKAAGEARQAKSAAAVNAAGKPHFERAAALAARPASGETAVARAANRINEEFGR